MNLGVNRNYYKLYYGFRGQLSKGISRTINLFSTRKMPLIFLSPRIPALKLNFRYDLVKHSFAFAKRKYLILKIGEQIMHSYVKS